MEIVLVRKPATIARLTAVPTKDLVIMMESVKTLTEKPATIALIAAAAVIIAANMIAVMVV